MQRRIIAAVAAVLLAGIGTILLYTYVNTAEQRAMASMESIDVLVVTKAVPVGTSGADIAPYVELKKLPKVAVATGALTDTTSVANLVTNSELGVGEQLLSTRFAQPDTTSTGEVQVPNNMQLATISLDPTRVVGSAIAAGDHVTLVATIEDKTQPLLNNVLVTRVQGATSGDSASPAGTLTITMALKADDVPRVVFAVDNGKLYVSLNAKDSSTASGTAITAKNVFK
jgi:pilus assembly protein CpaB